MSGRTRPRARLRRSLFGLTALSAAVLAAFSLLVTPAANAITRAAGGAGLTARPPSRAATRSDSATAARSASSAASGPSASSDPVSSAPAKRVCATPSKPGYAYCDALVRTDAAGHQGQLAVGVTPVGYGPADLQSAYALPSAAAGAGATVALIEVGDDPTAEQDLAAYRSQYGLPACTTANGCFRKINQAGGSLPPAVDTGWALETSLDMDMASAICPKCHILLVEADDEGTVQDVGTAENEAVAQGAKYISNSYTISTTQAATGSSIENPDEVQWDSDYYNHPGVVITASSGDDGYTGAAAFPADSPHVVAVGGTTLTRHPSSPRGWAESVWGEVDPLTGNWEGSGSGCSLYEAKPSWQTDTGCPGRTVADVAAVADPDTGVAVYDSAGGYGGWTEVGGTSAAAPIIASVYALAGMPVATTYPASYLYANPSALNNVTTGSNSPDGSCGTYPAYICNGEPGYNGPTGLGTPEGVAAFQPGPHGEVTGTVRDSQGRPVAGVTVSIASGSAVTDAQGRFETTALDGSYTATAAEFGYASQSAAITVASGTTATADFTLTKYPTATVSGTVTDASGHGWPLYAQVQVAGTSVSTYTNPVTGGYQVTLPVTGSAYTLDTSAVYPGYQAGTATVTPTTAGVSQDFGLSVDPASCDAPGYKPVYHGYRQTFSTGTTPAGWNVTGFAFNDPGHVPNYTGGSGGFALADADAAADQVSQMITQPIDLSGDQHPVLQFDTDLQTGTEDDVWVSIDGGAQWINAWSTDPNGDDPTYSIDGPATETIPLPSQVAGQPDVEVDFDGDPFWEVDNLFVGDLSCAPVSGGLVVGQVRDRNTGQPVDGAQVSLSGSKTTATSEPEPDDPAVGGGLYWLFSPASTQTLTASLPSFGYSPASAGVTVTPSAVSWADFDLDAPRLAMSPGTIAGTAAMGSGTATEHLTVANTGSAPATVSLDPQQGPVTVSGQPGGVAAGTSRAARTARAAAGAPLRTVAGNFGPGLPGKAGGPPAKPSAQPAAGAQAPPGGSDTSWVQITHFPENGYDAAAAEDPATGLVYLVGGIDTTEAWVFNPRTGTWSQLPSMGYWREAPAAAFIDGKLYVTAGYDAQENVTQQALEIYDSRTGLWSQGAPIPHAFYGSATAVLDGQMYVVGGCNAAGACSSRDVQVYDPATNTWTQAASYPRPIAFESCGGIGGELYCAGGFDQALGYGTRAADVYDPQSNAWSPIASMPTNLWGGAYAAANGQLLVSGGITRVDDELTNQGFAYDPATGAWSALPNALDTVYRGASACGMYQIGGIDTLGDVTDTAQQLPGYGDCGSGAQAPWLSLSQGQFTLAPGQRATVTVTLNAADPSVSQPGTYTATLFADATTPYLSPSVNAWLTATPPRTWGELSGTVEGKACDGTTAPLAGAAIQVDSAAGSWTLTTDSNGQYALWLDASDSPLTLIATDPDWQGQTATASLTARQTTTANFTLSRVGC